MIETVLLRQGDGRYEEAVGQLQGPGLAAEMWADAEHRLREAPGKVWAFVLVDGAAAAWCAAQDLGGVLVCSDNYERRGVGRERGLYPLAYAARHEAVVAPWAGPAVTYLFPGEVVRPHEADGWRWTGAAGPGEVAGHWWREFRREP